MKTVSRKPQSAPPEARRRRPSPEVRSSSSRSVLMAAAALVLVGLVAYSNSFRVPFLFDDLAAIPENPTLRSLSSALFPPVGTTVYGRPVLNLSFALNSMLSGTQVWSYHAVNLLIHLAAGLALFGIIRRTLLTDRLRPRFGAASTGLAAAAAGLWIVHPVHTECVTYIVQRAESLVGLFYLLTLYCFLRSATASDGRRWAGLAVFCSALGMGTKEVMATAPFLVLLYDRIFLAGSFREALARRRALHGALFATLAIVLALAAKGRPGSAGFGEGMAWYQYALTQPGVILHYLRLSLLPVPLVFDYLWPVASGAAVVIPAVLLAGLLGLTVWLLRAGRPAGYLAAWFFLILAPTSSVIPIVTEVAAEHRLYLPLAAIAALAVTGGWSLLSGKEGRGEVRPAAGKPVYAAAAVLIVLFAGLTFRRNLDYRTPVAIWSDTVAKRPANVRAHYNLAKALEEEGNLDEAVRRYSGDVLRLKPDYAEAHANLGLALTRMGRFDEAMSHYEAALKAQPNLAEAHNNMGLTLMRQGKGEEALAQYAEAVRLKPSYAEAWYNMGNALASKGAMGEAVERYTEAVRQKPDFAPAHVNLAIVLEQSGRMSEAAEHYEAALRAKPDYGKAHTSLGLLYARQGETGKARQHLESALRLDPQNAPAREALQQLGGK